MQCSPVFCIWLMFGFLSVSLPLFLSFFIFCPIVFFCPICIFSNFLYLIFKVLSRSTTSPRQINRSLPLRQNAVFHKNGALFYLSYTRENVHSFSPVFSILPCHAAEAAGQFPDSAYRCVPRVWKAPQTAAVFWTSR